MIAGSLNYLLTRNGSDNQLYYLFVLKVNFQNSDSQDSKRYKSQKLKAVK